MDKFNNFYNDDVPVCRFGPGGDFFTDWPITRRRQQGDPISKILKTLTKMLDATITSKLLQDPIIEKINLAINGTNLTAETENKIDVDKSNEPADTPAASGSKARGKLSQEPMLFDNYPGAGGLSGHKQTHGIRAHRRAKGKRTSFGQSWQGSLFEPYPESSKVA